MLPYVHIAPDPMGFPIFIECHNAAYLGSQYDPLWINSARKMRDTARRALDNMIGKVQFEIPSVAPLPGLDVARIGDRTNLMRQFDRLNHAIDTSGVMQSIDQHHATALELVTSGAARTAFDLEREDPRLRERYGMNAWGQGALLCRRLVEAGVTFVTLNTDSFSGQWDNHTRLPTQFAEMLPVYDQMLTALIEDLVARQLYDRVLLLVCGEFGRTPRINKGAGRDHWGSSGFALLGGGGLRGGIVVGSTTSKGEEPKERPIHPADILATVYHVLGIDPDTQFPDYAGRPVNVLDKGKVIGELL